MYLPHKITALAVAFFIHAPLFFVTVKWPELRTPTPLKTIEVGLGLQQALEVALLQQNKAWNLKAFGLPPLLTKEEPPHVLYSSFILVDGLDGSVLWVKPHPLLDDFLAHIKFQPIPEGPRLLSGYISTTVEP